MERIVTNLRSLCSFTQLRPRSTTVSDIKGVSAIVTENPPPGKGAFIEMTIQPSSLDQLSHIIDVCKSGKINEKLKELSSVVKSKYGISHLDIEAELISHGTILNYEASCEENVPQRSKQMAQQLSCQGIKTNERRFLLVGKTGVGKSTTANTILGSKKFTTAISGKSVTAVSTCAKVDRFDRHIVIVDSPGLCDTSKSDESIMDEIKRFYVMTSPGLHAIVLVVRIGRFTDEEEKTVEFLLKHFGEEVISFLMIVFTGKEGLEDEDETIEDFIKTLDEKSGIRVLLERIKNRYVAFGKRKSGDRDEEVQALLRMIDDMMYVNGQHFFTNESYIKAEEKIKKEIEEKRKVAEKEKNDEIKAHMKELERKQAEDMKKMKDQQESAMKIKDLEIAQEKKRVEEAERLIREKETLIEKVEEATRSDIRDSGSCIIL